ncbi:MAG: NnrU family protein [Pseudomonadales bacterium]|nr:NnrU family protein [Pseudomonadales bacterium]
MLQMMIAGVLLLGTHLGVSSSGLRGRLVAALGEKGYLGLYSLVSLATLGYLIWLYGEQPRYDYVWSPRPALYIAAQVIMPFAFLLALGGFLVKNPTNVGMEGLLRDAQDPDFARGVTRITRHPFQWGVVLWAIAHLVANGDTVSVIFFGTFLLLSGLGTVLIDRKKAARLGGGWQAYAARTSNLPFLAIAQGRNRLVLSELWQPLLLALVVYALVVWGHQWVSGVRII